MSVMAVDNLPPVTLDWLWSRHRESPASGTAATTGVDKSWIIVIIDWLG